VEINDDFCSAGVFLALNVGCTRNLWDAPCSSKRTTCPQLHSLTFRELSARLILRHAKPRGSPLRHQVDIAALRNLGERDDRKLHIPAALRWEGSIALAVAFGIVYFSAARLSLFLLTKPDGVAVFWPAAGIASGLLIAIGPGARWPVAVGTMTATIWANLLGDRNLEIASISALCNAGEALLIAWLIERNFGPNFVLNSVRRVFGMTVATVVGCAVSGIGGTAAFVYFHSSATPILTIWQHWLASDALGVVSIAPVVTGLASAIRNPPQMRG
jgi:hypothetical protein